jgi:predicted kinase
MVRAKVAAMAARDAAIGAADQSAAAESARRHLRLAAATVVEAGQACWIAACGPPASGKSLLLATLARETGWPLLQSDVVRKELAGVPPTTRLGAAMYGEDATERTYETLLTRAGQVRPPVLVDATWPTRRRRSQLFDAAQRAGARTLLLHLAVTPDEARARLRRRASDPRAESDADEAVYDRLAPRFEAPTDDEGPVLHLSGEAPCSSLLDRVLAHLLV